MQDGAGRDTKDRRAGMRGREASRLRWLRVQAVASLVGPILFMVASLVQSLLRSDHDPITLAFSALSVGPYGWVQDANFIVFGVLVLVFAPALHVTLRPVRTGFLGPGLVAVMGIGFVASGLLPALDEAGAFSQEEVGHAVGVWLITIGAALAPIVIAYGAKDHAEWRGLATYSLWNGIAILVLAIGFVAFSRPPGSILHGQRGLYVWIMFAVLAAWTGIVAWRVRRVAKDLDRMGTTHA